MLLTECIDDTQNLIVCFSLRKAGRQCVIKQLRLKKQLATRLSVSRHIKGQAAGDVVALVSCKGVQGTAGLPGISSNFGHAFFMGIEFLQNNHGQENVMFFETE